MDGIYILLLVFIYSVISAEIVTDFFLYGYLCLRCFKVCVFKQLYNVDNNEAN